MPRPALFPYALTALLLSACAPKTESVPGDGGDDTADGGSDGGGSDSVTIQQIQDGTAPDGSSVTLKDVVVTSPITQLGDGFFVQTQGGGPWSGIYVFMQGGTDELFLSVGDRVNLSGVVTEYYDWTELTVSSITAVEITGEAEVTVDEVTPMSTTDWEQWESCLISIGSATVSSVNSYGQADLGNGLFLDDLLTDFDATSGATYNNVTGLVGYSFEAWILAPRTTDDLAGYTAGAPTTTADIQENDLTGSYRIENAVATTGVIGDGDGFYVQDEGGGPWSGIYVYVYDGLAAEMGIEVGKKYHLDATVSEYYGLTELTLYDLTDIEAVEGPAGEPVTDEVDPTTVEEWERWESCLISLGPVTAAADPDGYGQTALAGTEIVIDDELYDYADEVSEGATWTDVVGVVGQYMDSKSEDVTWKVFPRSGDDLQGFTPGEGGGGGGGGEATVADIQTGAVGDGESVTLTGVIATSAAGGTGFFVQDAGGGEYSGIYVYLGDSDGLSISPGDELTVSGVVDEYYDFTELSADPGDVTVTGSGAVTADEMGGGDMEPWEGCLVVVTDVAVDAEPNTYGKTLLDNGLFIDDLIWRYYDEVDTDVDTYWSEIIAPIGYDFEEWTVNPSSIDDFNP